VLALALAPLKRFGIARVIVTTMQAVSAQATRASQPRHPRQRHPFIGGEEEKMQQETQKIWANTAATTSSRWPPA